MVQKETIIRVALGVSAIGILSDIISTWWGLSINPDLRESGTLILIFINRYELIPGLIIGGIVNIGFTVVLYLLYRYEIDDGKLLWMFSWLRIWAVIKNILLAMRMSIFLITISENVIIGGMCIIIFNLLLRARASKLTM